MFQTFYANPINFVTFLNCELNYSSFTADVACAVSFRKKRERGYVNIDDAAAIPTIVLTESSASVGSRCICYLHCRNGRLLFRKRNLF